MSDVDPHRPAGTVPGGPASGSRLSAVELAAKRGLGPLGPQGQEVWHGQARPCPSCGELIRRQAVVCDQCGQDLSPEMMARMLAHAGPWYVHEHVRPFPGVTLERLVRQIRRGVLTPTTIVRGPTTFHQWRFAAETPGLSRYLSLCWNCQGRVREDDTQCPKCGLRLDGSTGGEGSAPPGPPSELERLRAAVQRVEAPVSAGTPGRKGLPASTFIAGIIAVCMLLVLLLVYLRGSPPQAPEPAAATPAAPPGSSPTSPRP